MTKTRTMVKWFGTFVATCAVALACSLGFSSTAYAETESVSWNVTYSAEKQMVSDYNQESVNQALSHMQPGDSFTMKVNLRNSSDTSTDWYMTSEAIKTLEEGASASGGAYTYALKYNGNEIYRSNTVGGDNSQGFKEISGVTGKWFYVATLGSGDTGVVSIEMSLDGETQDNAYMNTLGKLNVAFAVEDSTGSTAGQPVPDGDDNGNGDGAGSTLPKTMDQVLMVLYIVGIVAALVCTIVSLRSLRKIRKGSDA